MIRSKSIYANFFKPFADRFAALVLLLITSPVILITMGALAWTNAGKIWFLQNRPGKNGRIFKVIKFKTMTDERDAEGKLLPDDQRLTRFGQMVRKTSIDELPQLLNVLAGTMSMVGPRPLLVEYLDLYSSEQHRRHDVMPGITGWAQVNGRNTISWEKKFEYDVWYADNLSFWLDIKILFLTVKKVIIPEGISSNTSKTMEKFTGSQARETQQKNQ
jgi:undecaprenyl phosphate N,N'-diacetylbacillosamine 1-phosphate transferase